MEPRPVACIIHPILPRMNLRAAETKICACFDSLRHRLYVFYIRFHFFFGSRPKKMCLKSDWGAVTSAVS